MLPLGGEFVVIVCVFTFEDVCTADVASGSSELPNPNRLAKDHLDALGVEVDADSTSVPDLSLIHI